MKRTAENDEFLRKRKARQRRIRKRRMIMGFIMFLISAIAVGTALSLTVLFPIKSVNARGSEKYTPEQIVDACGIKAGDNLFTANVALEQLRERLPYIGSAKVNRKLPDTVTVTVTDAEEYACYKADGKYYAVSRAGYVLNVYDEKPSGIFEILENGVKCKLGKKAEFKDESDEALVNRIIDLAEQNGLKLDRVDVTDDLSLTVKAENRFIVNFGTSNSLESKFAHLSGMIKNIDGTKTGRINLSMWTSENKEGGFVAGSID